MRDSTAPFVLRPSQRLFSHQGWDTAENRDPSTLVSRAQAGEDWFGRADQSYSKVTANADIPSNISQQHQINGSFGCLLDRDGVGAGFEDYQALATAPFSDRPQTKD